MSVCKRTWTKKNGKVEEKWKVDFTYQHPDGTFGREKKEERVTLAAFTPRLLTYSENNNKYSSVVSKQQILEDHIIPFFGGMALAAMGPAEIEDFKAAMRKKPSAARARKEAPTQAAILKRKDVQPKPLSLKTINNVLTVLSKLMGLAEEQRVIQQAPRVKLFSKLPKPPFDFLAFEEAERLG